VPSIDDYFKRAYTSWFPFARALCWILVYRDFLRVWYPKIGNNEVSTKEDLPTCQLASHACYPRL
jgi:hypothetical protein